MLHMKICGFLIGPGNREQHRGYTLSASVGVVARTPDHLLSLEEFLAEADGRMYEVKQAKRAAATQEPSRANP